MPFSLYVWPEAVRSTRSPHGFAAFPFFNVTGQKAFCHPLHPVVVMPTFPPRLLRIKFQFAMLHWTMATFAHVANPNATASSLLAILQCPGAESHRIPHPVNWKSTATLCIT
jgi:hypothetical protein